MIPFRSSPGTVGIELELQLLDADSLDLCDKVIPLMELVGESPYIRPESIQNTIEVSSRVSRSALECRAHLRQVTRRVADACERLGLSLCGAGTHPFCERLATITPLPRYQSIEDRAGILGHTQITFATHVHLGMSSGDEAMTFMRELKGFLPVLIAMSASSPFWRGRATGFVSYRHRILAAARSYGIPPSFETWADFCNFYEASVHAGLFRTIKDVHWDIRPHPDFGTVEVRVMDAQPTIERAAGLAAFLRGLQRYLSRTPALDRPSALPQRLPWWTEKDNHFQASRLGLDAPYIVSASGSVRPLRTLVDAAMAASRLALADDASDDTSLLHAEPPSGAQRLVYERTGSTKAVTASLRDQLADELATDVESDTAS